MFQDIYITWTPKSSRNTLRKEKRRSVDGNYRSRKTWTWWWEIKDSWNHVYTTSQGRQKINRKNDRTWRIGRRNIEKLLRNRKLPRRPHKTKKTRWKVPFEGYLKDLIVTEFRWAQTVRFFLRKKFFLVKKKKIRSRSQER